MQLRVGMEVKVSIFIHQNSQQSCAEKLITMGESETEMVTVAISTVFVNFKTQASKREFSRLIIM